MPDNTPEQKMPYWDAAARSTCEKIGFGADILDEVKFRKGLPASESRERIERGVEIIQRLLEVSPSAPEDTSVINVGRIVQREIKQHLEHLKELETPAKRYNRTGKRTVQHVTGDDSGRDR